MTGQELYSMYAHAHLDYEIGVEAWDDLDEIDHAIWNTMASRLTYKEPT